MLKKQDAKAIPGYRNVIVAKPDNPQLRLLVGIPMTGTLRSEWVLARYGQVIPCNWSSMDHVQWIDQTSPIRFMVADARNLVVKDFIERKCEWLFFIDHDVILPPLTFVTMNDYMIEGKTPIITGLYFTKSVPSEPLIYRGRGNGYFAKWTLGEKVWADGIGMGCTLIHGSILRALWEESEEYVVAGQTVRRVFETPLRVFVDPETGSINVHSGTEDLEFCSRIIKRGIFKKAGWPEYAGKEFPFLIDTRLFCRHVDPNGTQYPNRGEEARFFPKQKKA